MCAVHAVQISKLFERISKMKTKQKRRKVVVSVLGLASLVFFSLIGYSGNMEPSAPPGPTMKTLDEVQPGTPISLIPYTIAESGYYYLTSSVQNSSSIFHGITIWADNVTFDLKGFSMIGDGSAGLHGVAIEGVHKNITIRDGTIREFDNGIYENSVGTGHRFIGVKVLSNMNNGISLSGSNHLVRDCTVSNNGTSASGTIYGILVRDDSSVTNNRVYNNGGSVFGRVEAIKTGNGCEVIGNVVSNNGIGAGSTKGIYTNPFCTVTGNTVIRNGRESGSVLGISASDGSTVRGNTVCSNGNSASSYVKGIVAGSGCSVSNNTVNENGNSASGGGDIYGIHAGSGCLVSDNVVYKNGYGALRDAAFYIYGIYAADSCTVMNNTASKNGGAAECFGGPVIYSIFIEAGSTVTGNTASKNATPISSAHAAGIHIGEFSLVDQNTAYDNKGMNMNYPGNCSFGVNMPQLP